MDPYTSSDDDDDDDDEAPILVQVDAPLATATATPNSGKPESSSDVLLPPCPVTILSGFLGSGKTTLVRYILNSPDHGKRIAVIENEFGDGGGLAIESLIARDGVDGKSLADLIELPNGCVCCTVKDSLVATLENLLEKRQDLDYILIECSGMANPGPVATIFWLDDALDSRLRLDGIVTLCDAAHIQEQFATTEEAAQQVAYADRILLNKIDLISKQRNAEDDNDTDGGTDAAAVDRLVQSIRQFHPTAPIRKTTFASCDLDWILDAKCFDADRIQAVEESFALNTVNKADSHPDKNGHDSHDHHDHSHDGEDGFCSICDSGAPAPPFPHEHTKAISTISLSLSGTVDLRKTDRWLASVLWPNQDERDNVLRELIESGEVNEGQRSNGKALSSSSSTQAVVVNKKESSKHDMLIFRIKGILSVRIDNDHAAYTEEHIDSTTGMDKRRYIVQGVHDLWEIHPARGKDLEWENDDDDKEQRSCRLVVIGRNLDERGLRAGFHSCSVQDG